MIYSVQILRGIAAMMVFFSHLPQDTVRPKWFLFEGAIGVDLFFIISGFIMAQSLKDDDKQGLSVAKKFLLRRVIRLYPLLIILSTFILLYNNISDYDYLFWFKSLSLIPFSEENGILRYPYISATWTLSFELFYYALIAALLAASKYSIKNSIFAVLILFSLSHVVKSKVAIVETIFSPILIEFAMGAFISSVFDFSRKQLRNNYLKISLLLVSSFLFLLFKNGVADGYVGVYEGLNIKYLQGSYIAPRWIAFGIPAAAFFFSVILFEDFFAKRKKSFMFLLIIGNASYSLYLVHTFLIGQLLTRFSGPPLQLLFINTFFVLLISIALYYLVEKPTMNFLKRFVK